MKPSALLKTDGRFVTVTRNAAAGILRSMRARYFKRDRGEGNTAYVGAHAIILVNHEPCIFIAGKCARCGISEAV